MAFDAAMNEQHGSGVLSPVLTWRGARSWSWSLAFLLASSAAFAQPDTEDDEDFQPGLVAEYVQPSSGLRVRRIDADIQFRWDSAAPDSRLAAGPFEAAWTGRLLIQAPGTYRLHLYLNGTGEVRLNDAVVVSGRSSAAGWITGEPRQLSGEQALTVRFTMDGNKADGNKADGNEAQCKLYWSSDSFGLEPVPPHLLFHDDPHPELTLLERGAAQFAAHRCNRCHTREHDIPAPAAPALTHLNFGTDPAWLTNWLLNPRQHAPQSRMPQFGFTRQEADSITAFLISVGTNPETELPGRGAKDAARNGEVLFRSLGCLACHQRGETVSSATAGTGGTWSGGDLTQIHRKRTADWLALWLTHPERLNEDHRMPVFALEPAEIAQLTTYLSSSDAKSPAAAAGDSAKPSDAVIAQGKQLVTAARCAACHKIPGIPAPAAPLPTLAATPRDPAQCCLQDQPDRRTWRPAYPGIDRPAVEAYLQSRVGPLARESRFEQGRRLLAWNNCLACHPRHGSQGIGSTAAAMATVDPDLTGQSEGMVPPSLNAIGDKLHDAALAIAVQGAPPERRLPWLRVRMPRFAHSAADLQALTAYLIEHDRIPPHAPGNAAAPVTATDAETHTRTLLAAHTLVGGKGFSCVACHKFGTFAPRNVALGTRGSDLLQIGRRMRAEYFDRWLRSPLRIVRDMEMPGYQKPVAGVLDGQLDRQLAAIWEGLNDSQFTVPADPSVIEQSLTVAAGDPARVVRDVFQLPAEKPVQYLPRSFAVGFGNQHNVLFDLDRFTLREWWVGDFATQRTQGKSWYWQPAGVRVAGELAGPGDIVLQSSAAGPQPLIHPMPEGASVGRLIAYAPAGSGVRLEYALRFSSDGEPREVRVQEVWSPLESTGQKSAGWRRDIQAAHVPARFFAVFLRPNSTFLLGSHAIEPVSPGVWEAVQDNAAEIRGLRFVAQQPAGDAVAAIEYRATAMPETVAGPLFALPPLVPEPVTTVPGFDGVRLPLPRSIMPTGIAWTNKGELCFTSLRGHVYRAKDTDGDGLEDQLSVFEEGLAAPFGLLADGDDLIVAHKPELLRLRDADGDGRAERREVFATGWGYTDDYHDWTCGPVRDSKGNLFVTLSSDYADRDRPRDACRWRGKALRIDPRGHVTPVGHALRFPIGLAIDADDEVFITDNQGVQNTFNEINHLEQDAHYGVASLTEEPHAGPPRAPAIQVPHPWTRSVNGIFFLPRSGPAAAKLGPFAGHGIGCEYDSRFLVRFTVQRVGDVYQGAVYPFSVPSEKQDSANFEGTLCGAVSPAGDIYIGCIHDSGWLGGLNVGNIVRLRANAQLPLGIREIRAEPTGFVVDFTGPVDCTRAADPANFTISGYTRVWQGAYATPDSGRHKLQIQSAVVSADARSVQLKVAGWREGNVYELSCTPLGPNPDTPLWPAIGHYTLHRIPPM